MEDEKVGTKTDEATDEVAAPDAETLSDQQLREHLVSIKWRLGDLMDWRHQDRNEAIKRDEHLRRALHCLDERLDALQERLRQNEYALGNLAQVYDAVAPCSMCKGTGLLDAGSLGNMSCEFCNGKGRAVDENPRRQPDPISATLAASLRFARPGHTAEEDE